MSAPRFLTITTTEARYREISVAVEQRHPSGPTIPGGHHSLTVEMEQGTRKDDRPGSFTVGLISESDLRALSGLFAELADEIGRRDP